MRKPRSKNKTTPRRRREIIRAALACFTELGYDQTNISDIRARARASVGSLYHHFGSKEQLAGEVYLEGIRDYQAGLVAILEKQADAKKGVYAIVCYHLKWVGRNKAWARFLFRMRHLPFMSQTEGKFADLNKEFFLRVGVWFRKQVALGTICRLRPDLYQPILLGPCQEFAREYLARHTATDIEAAARVLAAAAWRALERSEREDLP
jgi:AcrR family transcriptional regulator